MNNFVKMSGIEKKEINVSRIGKEYIALHKAYKYLLMSLELREKYLAYYTLLKNDFSLPEGSEVWKSIDESPEFYEEIQNKKLLPQLLL